MATKVVPIAPLGVPFHGAAAPNDTKPAHHTITTHIPTWNLMLEFTKKDPAFFAKFVDFYPRFIPHKDIKQVIGAILGAIKTEGTMGLPYPSLKTAQESVDYISGSKRTDEKETVPKDQLSIRAFEANGLRVYMVLFPMPQMPNVIPWWQNTGTGISSRLAEHMLKDIASLKEVDIETPRPQWDQGPTRALSKRIVDLLEREPVVGPARSTKVQPSDVYLYTSGMTAICAVHDYLLRWRSGPTVLFGLAFHQTIHIFEYWGPGIKHFPLATEHEQLESYLKAQKEAGTPVQAVWTEYPSNPLIVSADLWKLREVCDKYNTVLVVDDTVASFCNVDILPVADVIVTSLTKSFNGYGDAIAGSAVLNPNSALYSDLKPHFDTNYGNDFYSGDAQKLLDNSEDYLARSATLNNNAAKIVEYLHQQAKDPSSPVAAVYYPTVNPSKPHYDAFKRPSTADFTPGYGCLFSVELDSEQTTIAFYDGLKVNNGPHLGFHRTLALPYVKALYEDMAVVRPMGLTAEQIRVSVGLEPEEELLQLFKDAVDAAGLVKPQAEEAGELRMEVSIN